MLTTLFLFSNDRTNSSTTHASGGKHATIDLDSSSGKEGEVISGKKAKTAGATKKRETTSPKEKLVPSSKKDDNSSKAVKPYLTIDDFVPKKRQNDPSIWAVNDPDTRKRLTFFTAGPPLADATVDPDSSSGEEEEVISTAKAKSPVTSKKKKKKQSVSKLTPPPGLPSTSSKNNEDVKGGKSRVANLASKDGQSKVTQKKVPKKKDNRVESGPTAAEAIPVAEKPDKVDPPGPLLDPNAAKPTVAAQESAEEIESPKMSEKPDPTSLVSQAETSTIPDQTQDDDDSIRSVNSSASKSSKKKKKKKKKQKTDKKNNGKNSKDKKGKEKEKSKDESKKTNNKSKMVTGDSQQPPAQGGDSQPPPAQEGDSQPPPAQEGDSQPPPAQEGDSQPPPAQEGDSQPPPAQGGDSQPPPAQGGDSQPPPAEGGDSQPPSQEEDGKADSIVDQDDGIPAGDGAESDADSDKTLNLGDFTGFQKAR